MVTDKTLQTVFSQKENKMAASTTWSIIIRMRILIKNGRLAQAVLYESSLALQRSIFRENRTYFMTFIAR